MKVRPVRLGGYKRQSLLNLISPSFLFFFRYLKRQYCVLYTDLSLLSAGLNPVRPWNDAKRQTSPSSKFSSPCLCVGTLHDSPLTHSFFLVYHFYVLVDEVCDSISVSVNWAIRSNWLLSGESVNCCLSCQSSISYCQIPPRIVSKRGSNHRASFFVTMGLVLTLK